MTRKIVPNTKIADLIISTVKFYFSEEYKAANCFRVKEYFIYVSYLKMH